MIELTILDKNGILDKWELADYIQKNSALHKRARSGEPKYADALGWLDVREWACVALLDQLRKKADEVRRSADVLILVGVGGSNQAARAVIEAFPRRNDPEILYSGNSLSSTGMAELLRSIQGKSVYINVIAKNFETLEPGVCFRTLRAHLESAYGEAAADRIIVTGTPEAVCTKLRCKTAILFSPSPKISAAAIPPSAPWGYFPWLSQA